MASVTAQTSPLLPELHAGREATTELPGLTNVPAATEVVVTVFDRGESSGRVAVSRAVVPGAALHAAPLSSLDAPLEFSASYLVPRDFRKQAARQAGESARFFGYRVELFCHGELQDQRDQPANLLPAE